MKKQYKKPMTEVFDLKVMRLMDDSQVVIYSTTVNQNSDGDGVLMMSCHTVETCGTIRVLPHSKGL